ncbi:MAG: Lrp/AsnC family transcriptional regulator [Cytophagales bacterium]|nr:Lrp/AsnC family transcriptional regulator [Cytophagales bacterium]
MSLPRKLDDTDHKILHLLQQNARMTVKEMSEKLNLSTTPIFERIKKLEKSGIIDHYTAVINQEILGKKLTAFAHISFKDHSKELISAFEEKILALPEVQECHYVTGGADFIIKILVRDIERYKEFITEKLFSIPNIARIESFLSLQVKTKPAQMGK